MLQNHAYNTQTFITPREGKKLLFNTQKRTSNISEILTSPKTASKRGSSIHSYRLVFSPKSSVRSLTPDRLAFEDEGTILVDIQ